MCKILTKQETLKVAAECSEISGQMKVEASSLLLQIQMKSAHFFPRVNSANWGGLRGSFALFRDNSESDLEKVMKLTEELMQRYHTTCWQITA